MKVKMDENVAPEVADRLVAAGHDVATVYGQSMSGATDDDVYRVVVAEARALITLDLDFANPLRFSTRGTAGIVVLRLARPSRGLMLRAVESILPLLDREPLVGRLWIVEYDRVRVHAPPDEEP